jgi:glycosyltransferase involved in cell wall biosynthesis
MGRPILASPLGGPAETVVDGQTGWLVPAGDAGAWAQAVETALTTSPEARARMGEAARTRIVRHYSLAVMARRTFTVYRHLLRRLG